MPLQRGNNGPTDQCLCCWTRPVEIEGSGPVEIVDLPMKNGEFPSFSVCLPEGINNICDSLVGIV